MSMIELDDLGAEVAAGDYVRFSYGIPPVVVIAKVVSRKGSLHILTPGHNPASCSLRTLRKHVGAWFLEPFHQE